MQGSLEDLAGEAPLFIALESYFKQVREWAATAYRRRHIHSMSFDVFIHIECMCHEHPMYVSEHI
jgi:hypothetical protein